MDFVEHRRVRGSCLFASVMLTACGGSGRGEESGGSASLEGGSSTAVADTGAATETSDTGVSSMSSTASSTSMPTTSGVTGPIFDVGAAEGSSGVGETDYVGPGSCRQSEIYGAAGGYPTFTDPAYADFDSTVLIMTSNNRLGNDHQLRVIDISGDPPPPNMNYAAPMYIHPSWTEATFGGGIFGLTLDSYGNIYITPSSIYGGQLQNPGAIFKVDKDTAEVSVLTTLPNNGPGFGNINYDCNSETLRVTNHEDCRIYQVDMAGNVVSTYHHGSGDVTLGLPNDAGEPNGQFCPLGERMWAVQSHYGRLYYSVWWEDGGRVNAAQENEIWSVAYVDEGGVPDPATAQLEAQIPGLNNANYSNPVSDLSFAATGWMLAAERTMYSDTGTSAHQSTTYELQQIMGVWQVVGTTYVVGELPNSSAGGVDHDFAADGYVWMTGDALDFYTPAVVYGVQGTPYGGGTIMNSTLIDHDGDIAQQFKTDLGDLEIPIPGDAMPPPPPPEG